LHANWRKCRWEKCEGFGWQKLRFTSGLWSKDWVNCISRNN
jgi:hypothetical protein